LIQSLEQFVRIELFGSPLTLKAETDAKNAQEVADYLVEAVAKVEQRLEAAPGRITQNAVLILAALNIINEYFDLKRDHQELLQKISRKNEDIIHLLSETPAVSRYEPGFS
jgi:cell division protein ZapA (FtsZ GTPase activity inhibitor)